MNEAKQYPGNWIVTDQSPIEGLNLRGLKSVVRKVGDTHHTVCEIVGEADAALIAAAPALLEALKVALPILEGANAKCTGDTEFIRNVRAAIAKAEGA